MSDLPDLTEDFNPTLAEVNAVNLKPPTQLQQAWIDYRALNGLIFDQDQSDDAGDFKLRKMPVYEFAERIGVSKQTLYDWQ